MRLVLRKRMRALLEGCLAASVAMAALAACDSTATLYISEVKFDSVFVVSAYPSKKATAADGSVTYEPVCHFTDAASGPSGLTLSVLLRGTQKKEESTNNDLSIRPGDRIALKEVTESNVTPALFKLSFDCVEPYPDADLQSCPAGSLKAPDLGLDRVDFYRYNTDAEDSDESVAVAVMLDMSGSMVGFVHAAPPYYEDLFDNVVQAGAESGEGYGKLGTDPTGVRLTAVKTLIDSLNEKDPLIVFSFNESKIDVVCNAPTDPNADFTQKMTDCFGTNRDYVLGDRDPVSAPGVSMLASIQGDEKGRTPLWSALKTAYEFMKTRKGETKYMHILVLGDGPDTCSVAPELNVCTNVCPKAETYDQFRTMVEADPFEDRIPIHFVQMETKGYRDRDPRQQEIACLTGGQYTFVNTLAIPTNLVQSVLEDVLKRVRYTFRGYWRFSTDIEYFKVTSATPKGGYQYALEGTVTVLPGQAAAGETGGLLVDSDQTFFFTTDDPDITGTDNADCRVAVRKPCIAGQDQPPAPKKYNECSTQVWWCDKTTQTWLSTRELAANGAAGCAQATAKIKVKVDTKTGEGTTTEYKEQSLDKVDTVCCNGECVPPEPPEVPEDVATPGGMACFFYDELSGWRKENPDDPASAWVYFATLKQKEGCPPWTDVQAYLKYPDGKQFTYPDDWNEDACPPEAQNCFPPPDGAGTGG